MNISFKHCYSYSTIEQRFPAFVAVIIILKCLYSSICQKKKKTCVRHFLSESLNTDTPDNTDSLVSPLGPTVLTSDPLNLD